MAEINKDFPVRVAPIFEIPENSTVVIKTYKVNVEPNTAVYKVASVLAKAFSLLILIAWFVLLVGAIIFTFTLLNNLQSVQYIQTQIVPSSQTAPFEH